MKGQGQRSGKPSEHFKAQAHKRPSFSKLKLRRAQALALNTFQCCLFEQERSIARNFEQTRAQNWPSNKLGEWSFFCWIGGASNFAAISTKQKENKTGLMIGHRNAAAPTNDGKTDRCSELGTRQFPEPGFS